MSKRDVSLLLEDIFEPIKNIEEYTQGLEEDSFKKDRKTVDAVVRNFEIIGEASNGLPSYYQENHPEIEWPQIVGLRNRIIHEYFDVDTDIIWFIVKNELASSKSKIRKLFDKETGATSARS